jgi:hypothetical protein
MQALQHGDPLFLRRIGECGKRTPGRRNGAVRVFLIRQAHLSNLFLGRRIEERSPVLAVWFDEAAVDVDSVDYTHPPLSCCGFTRKMECIICCG